MFNEFIKNQAYKHFNNLLNTLQKIEKVNSGVCRQNFRCHLNSVHDALNEGHEKIVMCFYIQKEEYFSDPYPSVHFINIDSDGNYIDNTLGRWSEAYDYYFIRFIYKSDFFIVPKIFGDYRKFLKNTLPWYLRLFCDEGF